MATQVSLTDGAVASAGALAIQTNGTTQAVSISTGQVATLAQNPILTSGTANGVAYLNGSKAVTSGSALVFDGTNLGVGVTPSATTGSGVKGFEIGGVGDGLLGNGGASAGNIWVTCNTYFSSGFKKGASGYATMYNQSGGTHNWNVSTTSGGAAGDAITFTQAMTLDASGNLGVGTTSPDNVLHLSRSSGDVFLKSVSGSTTSVIGTNGSNQLDIRMVSNQPMLFSTNNTERARIDSSGNLLVNNTNADGRISVYENLASNNAIAVRDSGSTYGSSSNYIAFRNNAGSSAGAVQHTASTTVNYATSSDARLKQSLGLATSTSVIDNIVIHDFEWKEDGRVDRGVFAQQAYEIKPFAVSVGNDEVNDDGILLNPWGVDYSKFVPDLIVHAQQLKKQVQEQQALINQLTARITALESA